MPKVSFDVFKAYGDIIGKHVTCPICGKVGTLVVRGRTHSKNVYFQIQHGDSYCYIGRSLPSKLVKQFREEVRKRRNVISESS